MNERSAEAGASICVLRKNRQGAIEQANDAYCHAVGLPLESIVGRTEQDLFPTRVSYDCLEEDLRVMQTNVAAQAIEARTSGSWQTAYYQTVRLPIEGPGGQVIGVR